MFKRKLTFILLIALTLSLVLFFGIFFPPADDNRQTGKRIEFREDRVYEFAALWVKPGKEAQLIEYFNEAFAIAVQYGIQPVLNLKPENSYAGDFQPSIFFVNEWPSLEAFNQFISDPQEQELIPLRDDALDKLSVTHAHVKQSAAITLKNGDLVEFAAFWIKPDRQEQLKRYYEQAFPIAVKYGACRLASFVPVNIYRGDLDPQVIGLNQWPNSEAFREFITDKKMRALLRMRDEALSRLVVNHNSVNFEADAR